MAEIRDFSPEQIEEAESWYKENQPALWSMTDEYRDMKQALYSTYFDLKMNSIELRPNQFVIGVDYSGVTQREYLNQTADLSKLKINLSFWNPHAKGIADVLAKDILTSQLSKL